MLTKGDSPFRDRLVRLPEKIKFAILASEISSSMVYHGNRQEAFLEAVVGHLQRRAMACRQALHIEIQEVGVNFAV